MNCFLISQDHHTSSAHWCTSEKIANCCGVRRCRSRALVFCAVNRILTRKLRLAIHLDAEDVGIAQGIGQGVAENWVVFIQLGDVPRSAFP